MEQIYIKFSVKKKLNFILNDTRVNDLYLDRNFSQIYKHYCIAFTTYIFIINFFKVTTLLKKYILQT